MSDDGESGLTRWSRLKRRARDGEPAPEAPKPEKEPATKRGGAAPVAGRRLVRSLPPLADAEQDPDDAYAAPPIVSAYGLPPEPVTAAETSDDEEHELTPEEREAVKNLPPIESLNKDSDFTPFLADNVPAFLRRKALKVLWRSDPVLATADDLDDCFGDYSIATLTGKAVAAAGKVGRAAKEAVGKAPPATATGLGDTAATGDAGDDADADADAGGGDAGRPGDGDGPGDAAGDRDVDGDSSPRRR